ncbi:16S rRNA (guanine(966)-N(2))-methyltransferase RsmD [Halomonas vilamensis]|uniref:Ribosomal RNA small subunit methyltransferase D n=1 Tax=Vreelandella vilamensis TaxID=531309 RepID=A0ABU1H212_9GAMM|nr:16S rRNA (guanine(966)-N(2))-methyltransferase RsmD [Halomonas vilamensis]MDR5897782.1 16S rRNA (guanine(966)-N(2))-methyltransferase RsmD [Halomonas vilamensis]
MKRNAHKRKRPARSSGFHQGASASGKLRIIGGDFRRRQLPVLERPGLRPTPDRVRETLFNWLGQALYGQRVLDLFAGTGALGIEALSREAASVHFIEQDRGVAAQIRANLTTLKATNAEVITHDALAFLATPVALFDLVFLDPPFHQGFAAPCCIALEANGWLSPGAMIYVETETALPPEVPANWALHRETTAGESTARLYQRESPTSTLAANST